MGKPIADADQPVIQQGKVKQTRNGKKDQAGKDHPFRIPNQDFPGSIPVSTEIATTGEAKAAIKEKSMMKKAQMLFERMIRASDLFDMK